MELLSLIVGIVVMGFAVGALVEAIWRTVSAWGKSEDER